MFNVPLFKCLFSLLGTAESLVWLEYEGIVVSKHEFLVRGGGGNQKRPI